MELETGQSFLPVKIVPMNSAPQTKEFATKTDEAEMIKPMQIVKATPKTY